MKTFLFGLIALLAFTLVAPVAFETNEAKAQLVTTLKPEAANDTLTNADTAYIYLSATARSTGDTVSTSTLDNISRSVTLSSKRVSGDPSSARVYLQASVTGNSWTTLDSLVIHASNTYTEKTVALRSSGDLLFKTYRLYCLSAGTAVWIPKGYLLRRSN